jgi:hypothetical protein
MIFKNFRHVKLCNVRTNPTEPLVATQATVTCHHRSIIQYVHKLDGQNIPLYYVLEGDSLPLIFIATFSNALLKKFLIADANFQYLKFFTHYL